MARIIKKLIIHCSDSPDTMDIGVKEISEWHKARNFPPYLSPTGPIFCGYHKVIRLSGFLETARPDVVPGVHCSGENHDSLAVCFVGKQLKNLQHQCLNQVLTLWLNVHNLSIDDVYGHYEWNKTGKTCPNIEMKEFREKLKGELYGISNG